MKERDNDKGNNLLPLLKKLNTVPALRAKNVINTWTIRCKLGEGGFGSVFKVEDSKGTTYALKCEPADSKTDVLKMEVVVLNALKKSSASHSCELIEAGRSAGYHYIVMTLVGKSLQDLRKSVPDCRLTVGCALSVGIQCLEAVEELHKVGYLHRDIKPANFAVSLDNPQRLLLLDFGMCRRFLDKDMEVRCPRWAAGFRGTLRYASLSSHISRELSRRDDLETWMYQQVELTTGELPWHNLDDMNAVAKMKDDARTSGLSDFLRDCPRQYGEVMSYIDGLRYYSVPNYMAIQATFRDALDSSGLPEFPYDWEKSSSKRSGKS